MSRILHIMLTALVIACPLWCAIGDCGCCSKGIQAATLCCCQAPQPGDNDPAPLPAEPVEPRQCICDGAVLANAFQLEFADVPTALFAANDISTELGAHERSATEVLDESSSFAVSGRMLRYRHMSLTL